MRSWLITSASEMKLWRRRSPMASIDADEGIPGPQSDGVATEGKGIVVVLVLTARPTGGPKPSENAPEGFLFASDSSASARFLPKGMYVEGPGGLELGVPMLKEVLLSGLVARPLEPIESGENERARDGERDAFA